MATELQYQFFKGLYEEETARSESLIDRGKIYLSIVSLLFGGFFLKLDWLLEHRALVAKGLLFYGAGLVYFLGALVLLCLALQVLSYEAPTDPEDLIALLNGEQGADPAFRAARIAGFTVAYERNSKQNDRRAVYLQGSLALIAVGVVLLCAGLVVVLV